jgi:hypothetical protein
MCTPWKSGTSRKLRPSATRIAIAWRIIMSPIISPIWPMGPQVVRGDFAAVEPCQPALEPGDATARGNIAGLMQQGHVPLVRVFVGGAGARLLQVI